MKRFLLRRSSILLLGGAVVVSLILLLLPTLACNQGWVQSLLNRQLAKRKLSATIESVSIGWFAPMTLTDVAVRDDAGSWQLDAKQVIGQRTLLQLLRDQVELGVLTIVDPQLTLAIDRPLSLPVPPPDPDEQPGGTSEQRQISVHIVNGSLYIRSDELVQPQQIASHVELSALWSVSETGKLLVIEPGRPLDHVQLTPEMCAHGLKFVAPVFADAAWTRGDVSLELDHCQIDVEHAETSQVAGRVMLHEVSTGLRSPLAKAIAQTIAATTQRDLPDSLRVTDESVIQFTVQDGRIEHTGFEFGLPELGRDLVVQTHGTVGFDKSLDLMADIPLPLELLGDGPIAQKLGRQTLHLPVRGTLDQPEVKLEGDGQLASQLLSELLNPALQGDIKLDDVVDSLQQLRDQWKARRDDRGPLLPRLRRGR